MADIKSLKQRLQAMQTKPSSGGGVDYKKIYWKAPAGKSVVRILPNKYDKENPFTEAQIHYKIGEKSKMLALTTLGENDPIVDFAKAIKKEDWELAKKISPKLRIFAQVVVRGEEDMGPRIWEFGKEIYQELLGIMTDEDYGDITDITKGRDITVETISPEDSGKQYNTYTIRVKPKETKISEDSALVKSLLSEQKNIIDLIPKFSYDEMKQVLKRYLEKGETEESQQDNGKSSSSKKSESVKGKVKDEVKSEDFDALFEEEGNEEISED